MTKKAVAHTPRFITITVLIILLFGVLLRVAQYQHNREFWEDEAILALEIMDKSPSELVGVLNYTMNYPIGFLLTQKCAVTLLGHSEKVFRLLPLLSGIASLLLFLPLARRTAQHPQPPNSNPPSSSQSPSHYTAWGIALVALLCFAANKHLIYYASEMRQYSLEVLVACLLYSVAGLPNGAAPSERETRIRILSLGLVAVVAVWLSLTSIYILVAITLVQAWKFYTHAQYQLLKYLIIATLLWGISFLLHYLLIKSHIATQGMGENLRLYTASIALPLPTSFDGARQLRETIEHVFYFPGGMTFTGLALFTSSMGALSLWKRNKELCCMLLLPILFAGMASALHQYPFRGRYLLFILPALCLCWGEGIGLLLHHPATTLRRSGYILAVLLLAQPTLHSMKVITEARTGPGGDSTTTLVLKYIEQHWQEGDTVYVHETQWNTVEYYRGRFLIDHEAYRIDDEVEKFFSKKETVYEFPHPERTPSGQIIGSGRFWAMTIDGIPDHKLIASLDAVNAHHEALDTYQTDAGNTVALYTWK